MRRLATWEAMKPAAPVIKMFLGLYVAIFSTQVYRGYLRLDSDKNYQDLKPKLQKREKNKKDHEPIVFFLSGNPKSITEQILNFNFLDVWTMEYPNQQRYLSKVR